MEDLLGSREGGVASSQACRLLFILKRGKVLLSNSVGDGCGSIAIAITVLCAIFENKIAPQGSPSRTLFVCGTTIQTKGINITCNVAGNVGLVDVSFASSIYLKTDIQTHDDCQVNEFKLI